MSKWLNELCPIILDMLQDASLIAKREVRVIFFFIFLIYNFKQSCTELFADIDHDTYVCCKFSWCPQSFKTTDCSVDTWSTCGKYRVSLTFLPSILLWYGGCIDLTSLNTSSWGQRAALYVRLQALRKLCKINNVILLGNQRKGASVGLWKFTHALVWNWLETCQGLPLCLIIKINFIYKLPSNS